MTKEEIDQVHIEHQMNSDTILEACYDGLRGAGYDMAELNPGGVYVEVGGKAYSVMVFEAGNAEQT